MNTFNLKKEQISSKGITLIALVITIIVLLILAGISIAILTGENGILTKTDIATRETKRQEIIEKAKLDIFEYETENEGKITDEKALEIIAKYDKNYTEGAAFNFNTNENGEEYITTEKEYTILVNEIWKKQWYTFTIDGDSYKARVGESLADWFARHRDKYGSPEFEETYGVAADLYSYVDLYNLKEDGGTITFSSNPQQLRLVCMKRTGETPTREAWDTTQPIKDKDEYSVVDQYW